MTHHYDSSTVVRVRSCETGDGVTITAGKLGVFLCVGARVRNVRYPDCAILMALYPLDFISCSSFLKGKDSLDDDYCITVHAVSVRSGARGRLWSFRVLGRHHRCRLDHICNGRSVEECAGNWLKARFIKLYLQWKNKKRVKNQLRYEMHSEECHRQAIYFIK